MPVCNRFRATSSRVTLLEHFQAWDEIDFYMPRFNVAPTQPILTVRAEAGKRIIAPMRWQFIPSWAPENSAGHFNARSEKVTTTPSFSNAIVDRRCLIPADGFYEWKAMGSIRQPYCFEVDDGALFAFAGIWDKNPSGQKGCAILTTAANPLVAAVHDRMPVILRPDQYEGWLMSRQLDPVLKMLNPYEANRMRSYPVSTRLNDAKNDDSEVAMPIELNVPTQAELF